MSDLKFQSAMEYLMTYGWAILIIGVVVAIFAGFGLFNSNALTPKASAGNCIVYRSGSGNLGLSGTVNLEGACNNEIPEYVAQFNGASSYISTGTTNLPLGSSSSSAFVWIYPTSSASAPVIFGYGTHGTAGEQSLLYIPASNVIDFWNGAGGVGGQSVSFDKWHFVGWSYSGGNSIILYLDGNSVTKTLGTTQNVILFSSNPSIIGAYGGKAVLNQYFPGSIADLQVYNTSLSANDVTTLYDEGIGGAPIALPWLVAWWPLNGNANDYSGKGNNGNTVSVTYVDSWETGYSKP